MGGVQRRELKVASDPRSSAEATREVSVWNFGMLRAKVKLECGCHR